MSAASPTRARRSRAARRCRMRSSPARRRTERRRRRRRRAAAGASPGGAAAPSSRIRPSGQRRSTSEESLKWCSEAHGAQARRDDHPRLSEAAATAGPSCPGKRAMTIPARRSSSRASAPPPRRSRPSRSSAARRDLARGRSRSQLEQIVDGGRERCAGRVGGRGVLQPAGRLGEGYRRRVERDRVLGRLPPHERRVELLPELGPQ